MINVISVLGVREVSISSKSSVRLRLTKDADHSTGVRHQSAPLSSPEPPSGTLFQRKCFEGIISIRPKHVSGSRTAETQAGGSAGEKFSAGSLAGHQIVKHTVHH